jgi:hypothetical protein
MCIRAAAGAVALAALGLCCRGASAGLANAADRIGGDFALERVDLRFVGGEKVKVLAVGQEARAEVEITFVGTGQLGGAWEIAEPATTAGSPQFRTFELVSRLLGMGRHEVIASPPLPTALPGNYLLRLRITTPKPETVGAAQPLRYFVGAATTDQSGAVGGPECLSVGDLAVGGPADSWAFGWRPVRRCIAYQVEFYEKDPDPAAVTAGAEGHTGSGLVATPSPLGRPPATGVLVPGTQTRIALGPQVAARLKAGRSYLWRVVGFGEAGKVLCESPFKESRW